MADQTPDPIDVIALAHRTESLTQRGHWVSIGSLESHRKVQLSRSDLDDLRAAATELRRLEAWKREALIALAEWDEVFDALGRPGQWGASKAESARAEVERIRAESDRVSRKDER